MKKDMMRKVLRVAELIHRNPLLVTMLLFGDGAKEVLSYIRGITSLEEAYEAYDDAPYGKIKDFAQKKCATSALQKLKQTRTRKEFRSIEDLSPYGCKAHRIAKYQIALLDINICIKHATTVEEIKAAYYNNASYDQLGNRVGGNLKKLAFQKWDKLALRQVQRAETIGEIKAVHNACPDGSRSQKIAFQKWDRLALRRAKYAETIDEVKAVHDASPMGSRAQKFSFEKWDSMVLRKVKESKTYEEIKENIFGVAPAEGKAHKLGLQKLDKLALQAIRQAKNIGEVASIYQKGLDNRGKAKKAAIQKMYELA